MAVKKLLKKSPIGKRGLRKNKKIEKKNVKNVTTKKNKTIVSQDIKFARSLASNDKKKREKTLKKLRVWISLRSKTTFGFSEMDLMRLWKGIFYCMWMSDKPLVQEDIAESISQLVHYFESKELTLLYTKCALTSLSKEWSGIDQYRLDKFQMLIRRIIRQTFYICKKQNWDVEWVNDVSKIFEDILLNEKCSLGLSFHITDIYCEELAKVSEGNIPENVVTKLIKPFALNLAVQNDNRYIRNTTKQVFRYLMFQSDVGMDYKEKFEAWSKAGFPTGNIDAMEKIEISDDDDDENQQDELDHDDDEMMDDDMINDNNNKPKPLDPRAGRVDVEIPQIPFNPNEIAELLSECKMHPSSTPKTRKNISILIDQFKEITQGSMPLGIKTVVLPKKKDPETNPKKAAKRLLELEDKLFETSCSRRKKAKIEKKKKNKAEKKIETTTPTPAKATTPTPVKATPPTPAKATTPTPVKATPPIPVKTTPPTPAKTKPATPAKTKPATPAKTTTPTPAKTTPPTPAKTTPPTPVKTTTPTPVKTTPPTPAKTTTLTPVKTKPATPVKTTTPTPVKTTTPTLAKTATPVKTALKSPVNSPTKSLIKTSTITPLKPVNKSPVKTPIISSIKITNSNSSTKKKVRIVLQKNTAQKPSEYHRQLRNSPQNPYDGSKKPLAGVLKPSPFSSPRNPFYKHKIEY